ncbi:hypothetical protein Tco_0429331 [Tanacetum coccineum]
MDDPNISMEEYIRLQAEKALSHGETFNWQTATYRKREYCDDEDDSFTNFKTKFPAIVFDDITSNTSLSCESTVSPLSNNEIDFRISFDEYDDEDYTPSVSCIDDLDFFKDFENEFPTIVYNDALTSKSDFLTEPTVSPQHIDEFNLKNETSLSKCDEKEQNVLYFNNLFPFNVIYPDNLKWDKDNDNDEIDIEQSRDMSIIPSPNVINVDTQGSNKLLETTYQIPQKYECAGDVADFRTWPGISLETSMMSTMDLDGVTCLTGIDFGGGLPVYKTTSSNKWVKSEAACERANGLGH